MEQTLIDILTWAVLALLGLATYFLRGIHADIKKVREDLHNQGKAQVKIETNILDLERRIGRLETHLDK